MKKSLIIVLVTILVFSVFGVSSVVFAQDSEENSDITIGYAAMGMDHPLFAPMVESAQATAEQAGVGFELVDANWDVNTQNSQLEDFITKEVDVVIVNPVTATETVPTLRKVEEAGIPVVAIDTRPVGFEPTAFISADHYQGGYIAGWNAATEMQGNGTYAIIWAVGNEQAASRVRGFQAGLAEACSVKGYENNFVLEGEYNGVAGANIREEARKITDNLLSKYPEGELDFIFGQTDEFGVGAYLATQAAGREDVKIFAMDNNDDIRAAIAENSNIEATTAHMAKEIGAVAVDTAIKIAGGDEFSPEVLVNFQLITKDNIQYDAGWTGTYTPSFSAYAFPQEMPMLYADLGSSTEAQGAEETPEEEPQPEASMFNVLTYVLIAVVVIMIIIVITMVVKKKKAEDE